MANDDWRLTVELEPDDVSHLVARLRERELEDEARKRLGSRVAVSDGGPGELFVYGDRREAVEEAQRILDTIAREHDLTPTFALHRWHALAEEWEDASVPLPQTDAEKAAEHARVEAEEREDSRDEDRALFEVRSILPSHTEATELADRLETEGLTVFRRWNYVLVPAATDDDANALAARIRAEAPQAETSVVGSEAYAAEVYPTNPFAFLGGLAG